MSISISLRCGIGWGSTQHLKSGQLDKDLGRVALDTYVLY